MMYCNINGGNTQHHFVDIRGRGMMYCKTKNTLLKNKNHTFAMQKPTFCTPKTILLQRKKGVFENPFL